MAVKKKRPWGAIVFISLGLITFVASAVLGIWMIYIAVNPWAGSLIDVRRLEKNGPVYYRSQPRDNEHYQQVQRFCETFRMGQYKDALSLALNISMQDTENAMVHYLLASAYIVNKNYKNAIDSIKTGNGRIKIRIYVPDKIAPQNWSWQEFNVINKAAKLAIEQLSNDEDALNAIMVMGHKIAWCDPPAFDNIMIGLNIKKSAARKLFNLAYSQGDAILAKKYDEVINECRKIIRAIRRDINQDDVFFEASRAFIISRALNNQRDDYKIAVFLLSFEKIAEQADLTRRKYLIKEP